MGTPFFYLVKGVKMAVVNDYIFYTQKHFVEQRGENLNALVSQKKQDIVNNAIKSHQTRLQNFGNMNGMSLKQVRDILENKDLINDLNASIQENTLVEKAFPQSFQQAMILYQEASKGIKNVEQFRKLLDNFLTQVDSEYYGVDNLKTKYYRQVRRNFVNNRQIGKKIGAEATPEERLFATIMDSSYRGSAFRFSSLALGSNIDANKLNSSVEKLYALRGLLGSGSAGSLKSNAFWGDVADKVKGWINDFLASMGEAAFVEAYVQGETKFFEFLEKTFGGMKGQVVGGGNATITWSRRFEEDPQLLEMFNKLKEFRGKGDAFNIQSNRTSKTDVAVHLGEDGAKGTVGISVKDYRLNDITSETSAYSIHTQSNTSLLTLLLRECEYSTSELITFINIAATIGDDYEGTLAANWETIKENVMYRSILGTLASIDAADDQVFYMSLNGRLFTISSILQNIQENLNREKNVAGLNVITGEGFNRNIYQNINRKNFDENGTREEAAQMRSQNTLTEAMSVLQDTKVQTSLNFYNLKNLLP